MSTPQHSMQSVVLTLIVYPNPFLLASAIILGALPDILRFFQKDTTNWDDLYYKAHRITWYNLLIPFWNVHIVMDYYMHKPEGGWKWWVLPLEIVFWIFEIIFLVLYFM